MIDPSPNNNYKTKKNFRGSYTEANPNCQNKEKICCMQFDITQAISLSP